MTYIFNIFNIILCVSIMQEFLHFFFFFWKCNVKHNIRFNFKKVVSRFDDMLEREPWLPKRRIYYWGPWRSVKDSKRTRSLRNLKRALSMRIFRIFRTLNDFCAVKKLFLGFWWWYMIAWLMGDKLSYENFGLVFMLSVT